MSLKKMQTWHYRMAIEEVIHRKKRIEILDDFSEYVSSIDAVHRIMNDPLVKAFKDILYEDLTHSALETRKEADKIIQDALPEIVGNLLNLARNSESDSVRERACKDLLWIGGMKPTEEQIVKNETPHIAVYDKKAQANGTDE